MKNSIALLGFMLATPALGATDVNLTIVGVGSQQSGSTGQAYTQFAGSMSGNCPYNIVYIDLSTEAGRGMLAIAMTARAANNPIIRVAARSCVP